MFYKYALEVSPSVMTNTLMKAFHISGAALGNLAACYFYAYLLMQIPAGVLLDKFGPRKMTTLAIGICAIGNFVFSNSEEILIACAGRFLTGMGAAFAAVSCLKLIANWFPFKYFAFMTGLMMTCGMLGAVAGQAPLAAFIRSFDWRSSLEMIGIVGMLFAIVFWVIVRDRKPEKEKIKVQGQRISFLRNLRSVFSNAQSWWLSVYSGFAFAPVMVFGGLWGVAFLSEAFSLQETVAAQSVSLIFIGFAVGAPFFGWFSDWFGRRVIIMFWGTLGALISISIIIYLPFIANLFLGFFLFLFGFLISSFLLSFTMMREVNKPLIAATAVGVMNAFNALFGALSDPLTGKFLDMGWSGKIVDGARIFSLETYKIAFLTLPIYLIIAMVILLKTKETFCKQQASLDPLP